MSAGCFSVKQYVVLLLKTYILWATPSAGPRSLLIASGLQILGIVASGSWNLLGRKLVSWHNWWLHSGVLGDLGPIWGNWGAYSAQ